MSFGFSIGDFIAVGKLSLSVYRSCRDAPESFGNISIEALSLHALLTEVAEIIGDQDLSPSRKKSLAVITQGCDNVLRDLQALVLKYESLGTQSKQTWDRMKWGMNDIAELRSRLVSNTVLLTAFLSTCQIVVERKLEKLVQEFQQGKHEGSVITTVTVETLAYDDQQTWRAIRKELEDIGISVAAFDANKHFILDWFQNAMEKGSFNEKSWELSQEAGPHDAEYQRSGPQESENLDLKAVRSTESWEKAALDENTKDSTDQWTTANQEGRKSISTEGVSVINEDFSDPERDRTTTRKPPPLLVSLLSRVLRHDRSFFEAFRANDFVTADKYLSKGANIDVLIDKSNALDLAVSANDIITAKWLLDRGSNPNLFLDSTLLFKVLAKKPPGIKMAQLLVDNGAKVNLRFGRSGRTPLFQACWTGNQTLVRWLLERDANFRIKSLEFDGLRSTPLHAAVYTGNKEIMMMLLEKGDDINEKNAHGNSILHTAALRNHVGIVIWLLDHGADIEVKNGIGKTPLVLAIRHRCEDTTRLLVSRGAKRSPLDPWDRQWLKNLKKGVVPPTV